MRESSLYKSLYAAASLYELKLFMHEACTHLCLLVYRDRLGMDMIALSCGGRRVHCYSSAVPVTKWTAATAVCDRCAVLYFWILENVRICVQFVSNGSIGLNPERTLDSSTSTSVSGIKTSYHLGPPITQCIRARSDSIVVIKW